MNNNEIRIGITGKILEGDYKNWFIFVENDFKHTGGYLILLFNHFDRWKSTEGYDYWAEDEKSIEEIFKEAKWKVKWLNANL